MDLSIYELINNHSSLGERYVNDSKDVVNSMFSESPSYEIIKVNGVEKECNYKYHKFESFRMYVILRPDEYLEKGMYVEFREKTYIIVDFLPNEVYPKAELLLCNNLLRWKDEKGIIYEAYAHIGGNTIKLDDAKYSNNNRFVMRSDAELVAELQYNEATKNIKPTKRFVINNNVFDVTGIDNISEVVGGIDGAGILKLYLTSTATSSTDNNDEGIADNSGESGWGEW